MLRHLLRFMRFAVCQRPVLCPSAAGARNCLLVVGMLLVSSPVAGQSSPVQITRIEEDWRVEVGVPDPETDSPQIITVISPTGNLDGFHAMFEINHMTQPDYFPGGMQLQCWNGEVPLCAHSYPSGSSLATPQEVITFTTRMALSDATLSISVINGMSTTWGNFGNSSHLSTAEETTLTSLDGYSPLTSTRYSRIGFASHQVQRLVLKEVRYYTSEGLHVADVTERVVHQHYATTE